MGRLLYWVCVLWWATVLWLLPWRAVAQSPDEVAPQRQQGLQVPAADALAVDDGGVPWLLLRPQAVLVSPLGGQWQLPTPAAELVAFCPQGPVLMERLGSGALWRLDPRGNWQRQPLAVPAQPLLARSGGGALTGLWVRGGQVVVEWRHRWSQVVADCARHDVAAGPLQPGRPQWQTGHVPLSRSADGALLVGLGQGARPMLPLRLPFAVQQVLDAAPLPDGQLALLVHDEAGAPWLLRLHPGGRLLALRELPPTDALFLPLQSLAASPGGQLWWLRRSAEAGWLHLLL